LRTGTFTVDNVGDADAVIADVDCKEIEIYETAQAGTTDYDVFAPNKTSTPVRRPAGAKTLLTNRGGAGWFKGQTAGYVSAVTAGSYTFCKEQR
jgi:hypothetical protein